MREVRGGREGGKGLMGVANVVCVYLDRNRLIFVLTLWVINLSSNSATTKHGQGNGKRMRAAKGREDGRCKMQDEWGIKGEDYSKGKEKRDKFVFW